MGPASGGTVGDLTQNNGGGSTGGFSQFEAQPQYQKGKVANANTDDGTDSNTTQRLEPDVSWLGGLPTPGVLYDSENVDSSGNPQPNSKADGTSLSAPMWAGLVAIIDQGRVFKGLAPLSTSDQTGGLQALLYSLPSSDFNDITEGFNGFNAGPGYDLVTGLGTPKANLIVNVLVGLTGIGKHNFLGEFSNAAPAIATLGDEVYVAWRGRDDNDRLNIMPVDPTSLLPDISLDFVSDKTINAGPALATVTVGNENELWVAWIAGDDNNIFVDQVFLTPMASRTSYSHPRSSLTT